MITELPAIEVATAPVPPPVTRWTVATRIGFRFFATYFFLYVTFTQMFGGLFGNLLALLPFTMMPPMRMIDGVERAPLLSDYDRWRRVVQQITS